MVHPVHYKQQLIHLDPSAKYRCHDKFKNSKTKKFKAIEERGKKPETTKERQKSGPTHVSWHMKVKQYLTPSSDIYIYSHLMTSSIDETEDYLQLTI